MVRKLLAREHVKMNESLTTKTRRTQLNETHQRGVRCSFFSELDFSSSFILVLQYFATSSKPGLSCLFSSCSCFSCRNGSSS